MINCMPLVGAVTITIQKELIYSLFICLLLGIFFIYAGNKIRKADPLEKPHGIVLVMELMISAMQSYMKSIMPSKFEKNYYPYFGMLACYLIVANLFGLTGFDAPTSCLSITLAITIVTFTLIQYNAFKKKGAFTYIKDLVWPPTNILSALSPLVSLSMRLFGNILSGSILMGLVYSFTGWISYHVINFNFLGPVVAPVLHCYFDIFAGCIQTLVFITLSSILIAIEAED